MEIVPILYVYNNKYVFIGKELNGSFKFYLIFSYTIQLLMLIKNIYAL